MAGGSDIGMVLVIGVIVLGGLYMIQQGGGLGNIFGKKEEEEMVGPPEGAEEQPPEEEPQEPEQQTVGIPYPVVIPAYFPAGMTRGEICSRYYGGSCNSECEDGDDQDCMECIRYCGPPSYRPRPPPRPSFPRRVVPRHCEPGKRWDWREDKCVKIYGGPGPTPGHDCPRGQRFNWESKRCEDANPPKPKPTPTPTPRPDTDAEIEKSKAPAPTPTAPEPATSAYASCPCGSPQVLPSYPWG